MQESVIPWVVAYIGFAALVAGLALVGYAQGAREPLLTTEIGQVLIAVGIAIIGITMIVNYGAPILRDMLQQLQQHITQVSSAGAPNQ